MNKATQAPGSLGSRSRSPGGPRGAPGRGRMRRGPARPQPLHLVRLHQARAGPALRARARLPRRPRHLRLERGHVRQAQGRGDGLRPPHPVELHGQPDARPGDAPAASTTRCCPTSSTSIRTTWRSPWTGRWTTPCPTCSPSPASPTSRAGSRTSSRPVADVRPRRPGRADDDAQRHARDDRGGPQVPRLQPQHDERAGARRGRGGRPRWKKNLAKFENEQYKIGLASGEFLLVHGYNGDILQVRRENPDIRFVVPEEGTVISCDDLVDRRPTPASRPWPTPSSTSSTTRRSPPRTPWLHLLSLPEQGLLPAAAGGDPRRPGDLHPARSSGPRARSSPTSERPTPSTSRSGTASSPPANSGTQYYFPIY